MLIPSKSLFPTVTVTHHHLASQVKMPKAEAGTPKAIANKIKVSASVESDTANRGAKPGRGSIHHGNRCKVALSSLSSTSSTWDMGYGYYHNGDDSTVSSIYWG